MKKRNHHFLPLLSIALILALLASGLTFMRTSAEDYHAKLTVEDIAIYVFEDGKATVNLRYAHPDFRYALLDSTGKDLTGWLEPKDNEVLIPEIDTKKRYSAVYVPEQWTQDSDPSDWNPTGIPFNIPEFDDVVDDVFVNPQDVERSKDGTIISIYMTRQDCEYTLYDYYSEKQMTKWKDGVAGVVVFTGLDAYRLYDVRARVKGTGPKPDFIPSKTWPMPGADVIVGEGGFNNLTGYGEITIWSPPKYSYALLGKTKEPLTEKEMANWGVAILDKDGKRVARGEDGYYYCADGGRMTFIVPAGGSYKMGGKHPDGETFVSEQSFQTKGVDRNHWYEYVVPKGESGHYRMVIFPACPYSIYKLKTLHSFIQFEIEYGRVKEGDNKVIFDPVSTFLGHELTAYPIPLDGESVSEGDVSGGDVSGGDVSGGDVSGGDVSGGDVSGGDVSGGDVSGGDVSGGDVSGGDASDTVVKLKLPESFRGLYDEDVKRSRNGDEITVSGNDDQQYALFDPETNEPLTEWIYAENGKVDFHSLDPEKDYLVRTQMPETDETALVYQPDGVLAPAGSGGDVSGGDISGGDVSGGDFSGLKAHMKIELLHT